MSTRFAIAINEHGVAYYLNPQHILRMVERGKGKERETTVDMTDDRTIVVRTTADDIARQVVGSAFIEITERSRGIRLINTAQIFSVDPGAEDADGCVATLMDGGKIEIDDCYSHVCDLLGIDSHE